MAAASEALFQSSCGQCSRSGVPNLFCTKDRFGSAMFYRGPVGGGGGYLGLLSVLQARGGGISACILHSVFLHSI